MNALKHGLAARTVPLPNEDPAAIAARAAAWADYYQPDSPAAHHLVNQCVRATLLADRCQQAHDSAIADQVDAAALRWEQDRQNQFKALRAQLKTDPAAAVDGLGRIGHGCRWLIACWEQLDQALEANGCWTPEQGDRAVRLFGCLPEPEALRRNSLAYLLFLFHLRLQPEPPEDLIAILSQPGQVPDDLRDCPPDELAPPLPFCRNWLRQRIEEQLERYRAHEERLRTEFDAPARARVLDRALVLHDEDAARLYFRYHAESRSTFHRAYKELVATLKRDAESSGDEATSPNEPNLNPNPITDILSPNEPDAGAGADRPAPPSSPNEPGTAAARPEEIAAVTTSSGDGPAPAAGPVGEGPDPVEADPGHPSPSRNEPGAPTPAASRNEPGPAVARPEDTAANGPVETRTIGAVGTADRSDASAALREMVTRAYSRVGPAT